MGYSIPDIPEIPRNPGPFPEQHGYVDIQVKEHDYNGNCSPINPSTHHNPSGFEKFAKNENTKKAGNFILSHLKAFLLRQCT